jgi:hypothetical protein
LKHKFKKLKIYQPNLFIRFCAFFVLPFSDLFQFQNLKCINNGREGKEAGREEEGKVGGKGAEEGEGHATDRDGLNGRKGQIAGWFFTVILDGGNVC